MHAAAAPPARSGTPRRRAARPARESGSASTPAPRSTGAASDRRSSSLPFLPIVIEQLADFLQLDRRGAVGVQRLQNESGRRSAESAIDEVFEELPLCLLLAGERSIHMRASRLVTFDQALVGHDLHQLERGGVAGVAGAGLCFVYLAHGRRSAFPQNP